MRLIILLLFFSLSVTAQTKGDTIRIFLPTEMEVRKEMDRLRKQSDSLENAIRVYQNYLWYRELFFNMRIK